MAVVMQTVALASTSSIIGYASLTNYIGAPQVSVTPRTAKGTSDKVKHRHSSRKSLLDVSQKKLHCRRRGVSRGVLEAYTGTLGPSDSGLFGPRFIESVNNAISLYGQESGCSSPTTAQCLSASNNQWPVNLTGNTTDRSSSYSTVTYDDFDREASANVQKLFDDLDSMLFENQNLSNGSHLPVHNECRDWSQSFPHLRVLGHQVIPSTEHGYNMIEKLGNSSTPHRTEETSNYTDSLNSGLHIEGSHVIPHSCSASANAEFTEEVFELDGYYEDIIAQDSDSLEDLTDSKATSTSNRRRRSRYPPVTPKACVKDDAINSSLDHVWNTVTDAMRILLQMYSEHFIITLPMAIEEEPGHDNTRLKLPQIPTRLEAHATSNLYPQVFGNHQSRSSTAQAHSSNSDNLNKLLQIRPMNFREKTLFREEGVDTPTTHRPAIKDSKGRLGPPRNSSGRKAPRKHLMPISDRGRTPNGEEEVSGIRGTGITVGKRLSSPPSFGIRTLPPINQPDLPLPQLGHTDTTPPQTTRMQASKKGNRASSAIAEKDSRPNMKEKAAFSAETRPSTTHTTYPTADPSSVLMQQHVSTPVERQYVRARNGDVKLGVMGSSLGGPHTVVDEEGEGRYDPVAHHSQWGQPHTPVTGIRRKGPAIVR